MLIGRVLVMFLLEDSLILRMLKRLILTIDVQQEQLHLTTEFFILLMHHVITTTSLFRFGIEISLPAMI